MPISTTTPDKFQLAETAPTSDLRARVTAELIDQIKGAFIATPSLPLGRTYDAIIWDPDRYRVERAYGSYRPFVLPKIGLKCRPSIPRLTAV